MAKSSRIVLAQLRHDGIDAFWFNQSDDAAPKASSRHASPPDASGMTQVLQGVDQPVQFATRDLKIVSQGNVTGMQ